MMPRLIIRTGIIAATVFSFPCMTVMAANLPVVEAQGKLSSVLVKSDGATIERTLSAMVPAGASRIVLHGLPVSSQSSGMQISGTAVGSLSIGSVNMRKTTTGMLPSATARKSALEIELQELGDRSTQFDVVLAGAKATRDAVTALLSHPNPGTEPRTLVALARDAMSEAAESIRAVDIAKRTVVTRVKAVEDEVVRLNTEASVQTIDLIVDVESEREGEVHLNIHHDVAEASWSSAYEARLDTRQHSMGLVQVALVQQSTGEDWNDVHLVLSSSRAMRGTSPPMGRGQLLSLQPLAPVVSSGPPGSITMNLSRAGNSADVAVPTAANMPAVIASADIDMRGLAVEYSVGGRVRVPSRPLNGILTRATPNPALVIIQPPQQLEFERFRVAELSVHDVVIRTVSLPSQGATAWLQAEFVSPGVTSLPAGSVILDVDGARVGESNLAAMSPGEIVVLGFGADSAVKVNYEPQEVRQSSEFGLSGRRSINTKAAIVTVKNSHTIPWDIRILEPVPVSGDENIAVETVMDPVPSSVKFSDIPGLYAWNFTMPPNDEKRIKSGWNVTSPNGKPVSSKPTQFSLEKR